MGKINQIVMPHHVSSMTELLIASVVDEENCLLVFGRLVTSKARSRDEGFVTDIAHKRFLPIMTVFNMRSQYFSTCKVFRTEMTRIFPAFLSHPPLLYQSRTQRF